MISYLTLIQEKTFRYFYDFAHPSCGLARERNSSARHCKPLVAPGFGVMALIIGMERGFITRDQGDDETYQNIRFPRNMRSLAWRLAALA